MVEYLADCVRALAEQDIIINAVITDEEENQVTENCRLVLHEKDREKMILSVEGRYLPENLIWEFVIPASATKGLRGRYWYCVQWAGNAMCFKQPMYLI
ncbi:MAG: hypothetical protein IKY67_06700 [Paludibacteraceae bacterium]|nr:hypothetical protein [Paludibacteraceae bacterium]